MANKNYCSLPLEVCKTHQIFSKNGRPGLVYPPYAHAMEVDEEGLLTGDSRDLHENRPEQWLPANCDCWLQKVVKTQDQDIAGAMNYW